MSYLMIIMLLFQISTPEPMPYPTPNPEIDTYQQEAEALAATAEAIEPGITTDGQQIYDEDGRAMLPDFSSASMITALGYAKWALDAQNVQAVFGPFAPIIRHIRILFTLSLALVVAFFQVQLLRLLAQFAMWLFQYAARLLLWGFVAFVGFIFQYLFNVFGFFIDAITWIMDKIPGL